MTEQEKNAVRAWLDLLTASNTIKKEIDASFRREFGHSISRFDVLSALDRAGADGLRASALSEFLLVTDGATTQITAPLVRDGIVARRQCSEDRRSAFFTLTAKGSKLFESMAERHRQWVGERFSAFSPEQIQSLRSLIRNIKLPDRAAKPERTAA